MFTRTRVDPALVPAAVIPYPPIVDVPSDLFTITLIPAFLSFPISGELKSTSGLPLTSQSDVNSGQLA